MLNGPQKHVVQRWRTQETKIASEHQTLLLYKCIKAGFKGTGDSFYCSFIQFPFDVIIVQSSKVTNEALPLPQITIVRHFALTMSSRKGRKSAQCPLIGWSIHCMHSNPLYVTLLPDKFIPFGILFLVKCVPTG